MMQSLNRNTIIADFKMYVIDVTILYFMIIVFVLVMHYSFSYVLTHEQYNLTKQFSINDAISNTMFLGMWLIAFTTKNLYLLIILVLCCSLIEKWINAKTK